MFELRLINKNWFLILCLFYFISKSYFGDQGNMKLTSKKSVQFFMKFLSDLVPHEPAEYLKVLTVKCPLPLTL